MIKYKFPIRVAASAWKDGQVWTWEESILRNHKCTTCAVCLRCVFDLYICIIKYQNNIFLLKTTQTFSDREEPLLEHFCIRPEQLYAVEPILSPKIGSIMNYMLSLNAYMERSNSKRKSLAILDSVIHLNPGSIKRTKALSISSNILKLYQYRKQVVQKGRKDIYHIIFNSSRFQVQKKWKGWMYFVVLDKVCWDWMAECFAE